MTQSKQLLVDNPSALQASEKPNGCTQSSKLNKHSVDIRQTVETSPTCTAAATSWRRTLTQVELRIVARTAND